MSEINATRAALNAAIFAGLISSWEEPGPGRFRVTHGTVGRLLTPHGVRCYLAQWIADEARERPPVTRTSLWLVLLDRMEDLAETCRWVGVAP